MGMYGLTHSLYHPQRYPLGRLQIWALCCRYNQWLKFSFLILPRTHHCWVDRACMIHVWEAHLTTWSEACLEHLSAIQVLTGLWELVTTRQCVTKNMISLTDVLTIVTLIALLTGLQSDTRYNAVSLVITDGQVDMVTSWLVWAYMI